jgi:hypothetical protein
LKRLPARAVLLFSDATILRWFPPLRDAWGFRGAHTRIEITGQNAKRVLFGTINPRTGHRVVLHWPRQRQEDSQAFLRELRRRYLGRPMWLLLDKAPCQQAIRSQQLPARDRHAVELRCLAQFDSPPLGSGTRQAGTNDLLDGLTGMVDDIGQHASDGIAPRNLSGSMHGWPCPGK